MRIFFWSVLLLGMWIIFSDSLDAQNLLVGGLISISIAFIYAQVFAHENFKMLNFFWLFVYLLVLIKNLIISNIQIAKRTLSKDMKLDPAIVAVKTELKSDWKKLLLANSVTLTPGTLTLDVKGDTLFIHTIECKNIEDKYKITEEFERVIAKI